MVKRVLRPLLCLGLACWLAVAVAFVPLETVVYGAVQYEDVEPQRICRPVKNEN